MSTSIRGPRASAHLDLIRWIAAFEVLLGHSRSLVFKGYYDLRSPGLVAKFFYFIATPSSGVYARSETLLAGFSYSLYIFHMPILVFLRNWLIPGRSWSPDLPNFLKATVIAVSVSIYAFAFLRLTEAKTDVFRRGILGCFIRHRDQCSQYSAVGQVADTRPS
jgi:peptidoglycan/LPS O-acetylase OafA/YrhL